MPLVQITLLTGRTLDQRRAMVEQVTDAIVDSIGVAPEAVRIYLREITPDDCAFGGVLASDGSAAPPPSEGDEPKPLRR